MCPHPLPDLTTRCIWAGVGQKQAGWGKFCELEEAWMGTQLKRKKKKKQQAVLTWGVNRTKFSFPCPPLWVSGALKRRNEQTWVCLGEWKVWAMDRKKGLPPHITFPHYSSSSLPQWRIKTLGNRRVINTRDLDRQDAGPGWERSSTEVLCSLPVYEK